MPLTVKKREVASYVTSGGSSPFDNWLNGLRDRKVKSRILDRLNRAQVGVFGGCKSIGGGCWELIFDFGPGYRVYFGVHQDSLVLLLGGGTKKRQQADIDAAKELWKAFLKEEGG